MASPALSAKHWGGTDPIRQFGKHTLLRMPYLFHTPWGGSVKYKDYYKILGVARNASDSEIKQAYRRLARKYHPDVSKESDAEERFKEVGEAYEVLRDKQKRASYDQLGSSWRAGEEFRPPPGWGTYRGPDSGFRGAHEFREGNFSDFFENLFGEGSPFSSGVDPSLRRKRRGNDQKMRLEISIEEMINGGERRLNIAGRKLNVRIPAGIGEGGQIRLAGQGEAPLVGGARGDLYLEITLQKHPRYRVDGRNLLVDLPITPWEAALGARIEIETPAGRVGLTLPQGSQSGRRMRLKGRGLPGSPAGDLYAVIQIHTPPAESDESKEFYRQMANQFDFTPRA